MRPTGLLSVTFRHLPFERIIELTAEAGLDGIEWGSDVHVPPGDLKQAEKIGDATRSAGLINFSYGSYWYADTEPEMIAETSAALGARWIRVWAGKLPSAGCPPEIRRRTVGYLQKICRVSAGLQIAAEWHPNSLTDDAVSAAKLIDEVADERFFCYFQRDWMRDNQRELRIFPRNRIRAVHVQYNENRQRFPLSDGMKEWARLLVQIPEDAPALLEFVRNNSEEQYQADAGVLKQLSGG